MAEWWQAHLKDPPLVIIRCGRGEPQCNNAIGEVKSDGTRVLAMSKNEHPEPVVPWTPLAAPTIEELEADIAERESQVLRYIGSGSDRKIVYKRRPNLPRAVAPIDALGYFSCREHGEIQINRERLVAFVADTHAPRRTYWAQRDLE
jgi:hypothetical protein